MGRQLFQDGPYIDPPVSSPTALTSTSIETLILGSTWAPVFANDPKAGKIYCLRAGGIISTSATASTLTLTPTFGGTGGVALGASAAQTVPASLSNIAWYLQFDLVFRTIGASGNNSTAIGTGFFALGGTAATAGSSCVIPFGGTSASIDATVNKDITIQKTLTQAGSMQLQFAYLFSRN
jgi:hypothetical protein